MKSSFTPQFGGNLTNTIAKMVRPSEDRVSGAGSPRLGRKEPISAVVPIGDEI
jgi:hypothetical protein